MNFLERWKRLWVVEYGRRPEIVRLEFSRWQGQHRQPHRSYHTEEHIADCLTVFDKVRRFALRPKVVEAALWWHDFVYEVTGEVHNEQASATVARVAMRLMGCDEEFQDRVYSAILATQHNYMVTDPDEQLAVDIDLSSLGATRRVFNENSTKLRQERAHVPWATYQRGQTAFLVGMLEREHIYYLPYFQERYEERARRNVKRAILQLARPIE